jgi:polar amino acid transport system substrate-binding protein
MRNILKTVFVLACVANYCCAYAGEQLKLTTGEYAPYTGENLPNGGPHTEVVRHALAKSGYGATFTFLPWKRGYERAARGEFSGTFPYVRNSDRENEFLFSTPYFTVTRNLFYLAKSGVNPDDLSTLKGKQLCVPLGFNLAPELSVMVERKELLIQAPPSLANCVDMLGLGRVDAFTSPADIGMEALKSASTSVTGKILSTPIGNTEFHFLVPKANPRAQEIVTAFDQGLLKLKKKGDLKRIVKPLVSR